MSLTRHVHALKTKSKGEDESQVVESELFPTHYFKGREAVCPGVVSSVC